MRGMTVIVAKPKVAEVRKEIRALEAAATRVNSSKESAREFLRKNGFITRNNKLQKRYG